MKATNETPEKATDQEKQEIEILKNKDILIEILKEAKTEGIVGEENTLLALINKICLRLVLNAEPTSSNIIVSDYSGAGKDFVVKKICEILVPEDMYNHRTDLSATVLKYWNADEDGFSWYGQVLHFEDPKEETIKHQTFKTMASGGTESTITINNKAVDLKTYGKPVMIVTSMKATIDDEGCRRWDALRLDTSAKQTEIIKKRALDRASGTIEYKPNTTLRNALQYRLDFKEVIIPFAKELMDLLPNSLIIRTQIKKLLDYIKSSAVLHQYNRETDSEGRIIATWFDYDYARFVFLHLKDEEGVALSKDEEELIKILRESKEPLSIRQIATKYQRHGTSWIYDHLDDLKSKNLIGETNDWDEQSNKEIKKIYATDAYECTNLSTSTWFHRGSTDNEENHQQDGSLVFLDFCKTCTYINTMREKEELPPLFIQYEEYQENQQKSNDVTGENGFINEEKKTEENQEDRPIEMQISYMGQKIHENKHAGYKIDIDFLHHNFGKEIVDRCIASGILVKKENDEYEFGG